MKIEIWSDFVCPFCYIGKRRLEAAIAAFPQKDQVKVEFKSFELDPNAEKNTGQSIHELLAKKYGRTVEEAKKMNEEMGKQASSAGLEFHFDGMKPTNTLDAHRLAKFSESKGKADVLTERLLKAYFTDSEDIGDHAFLVDLAEEAGLDRQEAEAILKGSAFENAVRSDEEEARNIGVQGVPFFVLNRKYAISGAQPVEVFADALQKVWEEEVAQSALQPIGAENTDGMVCNEDGCEIPGSNN